MSKVKITKPSKWILAYYTPKFFEWWSKINGFGVGGMTLPGVILTRYHDGTWDKYKNTHPRWYKRTMIWWKGHMQHESIHIYQQLDLLIIGFFIAYGINYAWNRWGKKMSHIEAYMNIVFEKEAYNSQYVEGYLKNRKPLQWIQFLNQKNEYWEATKHGKRDKSTGEYTAAYKSYNLKYGLK